MLFFNWLRTLLLVVFSEQVVVSCHHRELTGSHTPHPFNGSISDRELFCGVTIADNPPDYTSVSCKLLVDSLIASSVSSVAITPCGFLDSIQSVTVQWTNWSRRDYVTAIKTLKSRGLTVFVKPYLWCHDFWTKKLWTGDIDHPDSVRRSAFFQSYSNFILDNARDAQAGGADILCIGLELPRLSSDERAWRMLIRDIRRVYSGKLTYAAHGLSEARLIRFWDGLDYVGINAYPTLSTSQAPSMEELEQGSRVFCADVRRFWDSLGRPEILLSEVGFRSVERAWYAPWEWPEHKPRNVNVEHQALAYQAFGRVVMNEPWLRGVYWWKVFTDEKDTDEGADGFTPQRKPAWAVMRNLFSSRQP